MQRTIKLRHTPGALALLALLFILGAAPIDAQEGTTFSSAVVTDNSFDETLKHNIPNLRVTRQGATHSVNFLDHYRATGGLTRWGYPTSEVIEEETGNLAQYYQRGVVDWHWRADLGRYVMERRLAWDYYGGGAGGSVDQGVEPGITNPHPGTSVGPWGHKVSDFSIEGIFTGFKSFYESLGGVNAFGFPKTDARIDTNRAGTLHIQGATPGFIRQYFQAAVLEFHQGDTEPVKLRRLGDDLRDLNYPGNSWRSYAAFNAATPLTTGQQYAVPRVIKGRTASGRPAPRPTVAPRPTAAPGVTPAPGATATPPPSVPPPLMPTPIGVTSVWFATHGGGVSHFNGADWTRTRSFHSSLPDDRVLDVFIDSAGAKWFATANGLARLHDNAWTTFNTNTQGFPGNAVTSVHSKDGILWIGTDGSGAGVYYNNTWENFKTGNVSGIPSNSVRDVLVYSAQPQRVWLATANGVARYDNGQWHVFQERQGLASNDTLSLGIDGRGHVWVGTNGAGVSVHDGATWTTYNTANSRIAHDTVRSITVAPDGRVWLGTDGGVSIFSGGTAWQNFNTFSSGLVFNSVYDIALDGRGRVWVATNNGASLLEGGRWTPFQVAGSYIGHDNLRAVAVE